MICCCSLFSPSLSLPLSLSLSHPWSCNSDPLPFPLLSSPPSHLPPLSLLLIPPPSYYALCSHPPLLSLNFSFPSTPACPPPLPYALVSLLPSLMLSSPFSPPSCSRRLSPLHLLLYMQRLEQERRDVEFLKKKKKGTAAYNKWLRLDRKNKYISNVRLLRTYNFPRVLFRYLVLFSLVFLLFSVLYYGYF